MESTDEVIPARHGENWQAFAKSVLESRARRLAIVSPPGVGVSTLLQRRAARCVEDGGMALIVSPYRAVAHQWTMRLAASGVPIAPIASSPHEVSAVVPTLDGPPRGAIATTLAFIAARAGSEPFASLRPDLLILDGGSSLDGSSTTSGFWQLAERASTVIYVGEFGVEPPQRDFDAVIALSLDALIADAGRAPSIREVLPENESEQSQIRSESLRILGSGFDGGENASLPELHSGLSRELASIAADPRADDSQTRRDAIDLLMDRIESSEDDPRLNSLVAIVRDAIDQGRPCLISVNRISEGQYLAEALRSEGIQSAIVNSAIEAEHRDALLAEFGPERVLIVGSRIPIVRGLPARTRLIWWSSPGDRPLARDLAQAILTDDAELFAITSGVLQRVDALYRKK